MGGSNKLCEIEPGITVNKWKVLSKPFLKMNSKGTRRESKVQVECECGKQKEIKVNSLLNGTSSGCGRCGNRYKRSDEQLKNTSINNIYKDYKDNAKARDYDFHLNSTEFKDFIFKNCFYCDSPPSNAQKNKHTVVKYNGIDRLDNAVGYIPQNCVSCCADCNRMKRDHSTTDFLEHIQKILKNNKFNKANNPISEKKLSIYHDRATVIASQSHDIHTKVAALLIDSETLAVIAEGYNGFIRKGPDDKLPTSRPEKYNYIIHAETNLICNAVRSGVKTNNRIVYCTLSPCTHCLRALWQAGVEEFYFKDKYKDFDQCTSMLDLETNVTNIGSFFRMTIKARGN